MTSNYRSQHFIIILYRGIYQIIDDCDRPSKYSYFILIMLLSYQQQPCFLGIKEKIIVLFDKKIALNSCIESKT